MKPTTNYLLKIWVFALVVSSIFIFLDVHHTLVRFKDTFIHFGTGAIIFSPFFFLFNRFGNAIIENIPEPKPQKRELFILACFLCFCIWIISFSHFFLVSYVDFHTLPFFIFLVYGIYFFKIQEEDNFQDDQILDDNFDFKK